MFCSTNVPFDQSSIRPMFHSTKVPFDQCSIRPKFHSTNVPFDESLFDESAFDESVFDESTPTLPSVPKGYGLRKRFCELESISNFLEFDINKSHCRQQRKELKGMEMETGFRSYFHSTDHWPSKLKSCFNLFEPELQTYFVYTNSFKNNSK